MKTCVKCNTPFPVTKEFFYTDATNKTDGFRARCKPCSNPSQFGKRRPEMPIRKITRTYSDAKFDID